MVAREATFGGGNPVLRKELLSELEEFVKSRIDMTYRSLQSAVCFDSSIHGELEGFVESNRKLTFNQVLFEYIDGKKAADADIYKRAGIDRRHFSKIRSNPEYRPGKNTVVALALALRLDVENACRLLQSAGYSLTDSETFDLVILFCLQKGIYELHEVNSALDYFSLKPLGGVLA